MVPRAVVEHNLKGTNVSDFPHTEPGMTAIPHEIFTADLPTRDFHVYVVIASYTQEEGYALRRNIQDATGLSVNTVIKSVNELAKAGWIDIQRTWLDHDTGEIYTTPTNERGQRLAAWPTRYIAHATPKVGA